MVLCESLFIDERFSAADEAHWDLRVARNLSRNRLSDHNALGELLAEFAGCDYILVIDSHA